MCIRDRCIGKLSVKFHVPQIEVAIAELDTILILRHLQPLTSEDEVILEEYGKKLKITWYTQSAGLETVKPLSEAVSLNYSLSNYDIKMTFLPTDFTQVNFELNQKMINLALELLDPNKEDEVIDLFCGLGNFTLPISRYVKSVVGIEGDSGLVERAKQNASQNGISNTSFYKACLLYTSPSPRDRG